MEFPHDYRVCDDSLKVGTGLPRTQLRPQGPIETLTEREYPFTIGRTFRFSEGVALIRLRLIGNIAACTLDEFLPRLDTRSHNMLQQLMKPDATLPESNQVGYLSELSIRISELCNMSAVHQSPVFTIGCQLRVVQETHNQWNDNYDELDDRPEFSAIIISRHLARLKLGFSEIHLCSYADAVDTERSTQADGVDRDTIASQVQHHFPVLDNDNSLLACGQVIL